MLSCLVLVAMGAAPGQLPADEAAVVSAPASAQPGTVVPAPASAQPETSGGVIPVFPNAPPYRPPAPSEPAEPAPDGLLLPHNYVHLSPGLLGFTPVADAGAVAYAWGLAAGHTFTAGRRFAAGVGAFAEHMVVNFVGGDCADCGSEIRQAVRLGPEVRLGRRARRVFGYFVGRIGAELSILYELRDYDDTYMHYTTKYYPVYPWLFGSVGGGAQGLLGRRFLLGGESTVDIGGDAWFLLRFRLILGVRF